MSPSRELKILNIYCRSIPVMAVWVSIWLISNCTYFTARVTRINEPLQSILLLTALLVFVLDCFTLFIIIFQSGLHLKYFKGIFKARNVHLPSINFWNLEPDYVPVLEAWNINLLIYSVLLASCLMGFIHTKSFSAPRWTFIYALSYSKGWVPHLVLVNYINQKNHRDHSFSQKKKIRPSLLVIIRL